MLLRIDATNRRSDDMGQRIDKIETRLRPLERETAEIKGAVNLLRAGLTITVGD